MKELRITLEYYVIAYSHRVKVQGVKVILARF